MSKIGKNLTAIKNYFVYLQIKIKRCYKKFAIKEGLTGKEISQKYNFANYKNIYAIKKGLSYKLVKDNTEVI